MQEVPRIPKNAFWAWKTRWTRNLGAYLINDECFLAPPAVDIHSPKSKEARFSRLVCSNFLGTHYAHGEQKAHSLASFFSGERCDSLVRVYLLLGDMRPRKRRNSSAEKANRSKRHDRAFSRDWARPSARPSEIRKAKKGMQVASRDAYVIRSRNAFSPSWVQTRKCLSSYF